MKRVNIIFYSVWLAVFLCLSNFAIAQQPDRKICLLSQKLKFQKKAVSLVIKGNQLFFYKKFLLKEPVRLVLDFPSCQFSLKASNHFLPNGRIQHIGLQQFKNEGKILGRLVIHLKKKTTWKLHKSSQKLAIVFSQLAIPTAQKSAHLTTNQPGSKFKTKTGTIPTINRDQKSSLQKQTGFSLLRVKFSQNAFFLDLGGSPGLIKSFSITTPPRFVVDLFGVSKISHQLLELSCRRHGVKSIRFGQHHDKLRIVLDQCSPNIAKSFYILKTSRGLWIRNRSTDVRPGVAILKAPSTLLTSSPRDKSQVEHIGISETSRFTTIIVRIKNKLPRYSSRAFGDQIILSLQNSKLPSGIAKRLDTSDFRGVIRSIKPVRSGNNVELRVNIRHFVANHIIKRGHELLWRFAIPQKNKPLNKKLKSAYQIHFHRQFVAQNTKQTKSKKVSTPRFQTPGKLVENITNQRVMLSLVSQTGRKKYTGRRVSLFFRKVEAHNLLNLFAELSGFNIIIPDTVTGKVTLKLRNVPWDQALDMILKNLKLGMVMSGNVIRIAPMKQLQSERIQERKLQQLKLMSQQRKIRLIPINYATASQMQSKVKKVLSSKGTVTTDKRTNVLIVNDYVPFLKRAEALVRSLDTQTPQVLIEARIVEANINFDQQFGIQWGGHLLFGPLTGTSTGLVFPNPIGIRGGVSSGEGGGNQGGGDGTFGSPNYVINFPAAVGQGRGTALGFLFGSLTGIASLNLRLSMAESKGYVKIVSAPKIITLNKQSASISQGVQIPFSSASAQGTNVQFVAANLSLTVTPQVTADGGVFVKITVSNNAPDFSKVGDSGPAITTKTATTRMLIQSGETMVIGGIYSRRTGSAQSRVPFLSSIPILGALFKNYQINDDRAELLVFVTPKIINRAKTMGGKASR